MLAAGNGRSLGTAKHVRKMLSTLPTVPENSQALPPLHADHCAVGEGSMAASSALPGQTGQSGRQTRSMTACERCSTADDGEVSSKKRKLSGAAHIVRAVSTQTDPQYSKPCSTAEPSKKRKAGTATSTHVEQQQPVQFSQHAGSLATSGQTIVKQKQPQQAQHTQHAAVESSSQQRSANGSIQGAEGSEATGVNSDAEFPVEFIMAHKPDNGCMKASGKLYKVKWAGCAAITWEPYGC